MAAGLVSVGALLVAAALAALVVGGAALVAFGYFGLMPTLGVALLFAILG